VQTITATRNNKNTLCTILSASKQIKYTYLFHRLAQYIQAGIRIHGHWLRRHMFHCFYKGWTGTHLHLVMIKVDTNDHFSRHSIFLEDSVHQGNMLLNQNYQKNNLTCFTEKSSEARTTSTHSIMASTVVETTSLVTYC